MNHIRSEKGIALVAALCISAVLLIFAIALTYRMATYLRMLATSKEKNQSYYTAVTGTEQLRDSLRNNSCQPPNWCGMLGIAANRTNPDYRDLTFFVTGKASPAKFPDTADTKETKAFYTILLKDNDEFDNDYTSDSDEVIIAVATSAGQNETRTSIEAGLLFDAEALNPYKQFGQSSGRKSATNETSAISMQRRL
ncbi:MAG: hypothetical protein M1508_08705 [Nitrospirae bacterium]|nr:hypothetical protein [Nitrospirota bacterium]